MPPTYTFRRFLFSRDMRARGRFAATISHTQLPKMLIRYINIYCIMAARRKSVTPPASASSRLSFSSTGDVTRQEQVFSKTARAAFGRDDIARPFRVSGSVTYYSLQAVISRYFASTARLYIIAFGAGPAAWPRPSTITMPRPALAVSIATGAGGLAGRHFGHTNCLDIHRRKRRDFGAFRHASTQKGRDFARPGHTTGRMADCRCR